MKRFFFLLLFVVNLQVVIQNNDFSICLLTEAYAQHMTQEAGDNCYDSEIGWYMSPFSDCRGLEAISYKCIYCGTAFKTDSERNQHEETCPQNPSVKKNDDHQSDPGNSGGTGNSGGGTSGGGFIGVGGTSGNGSGQGTRQNNNALEQRRALAQNLIYAFQKRSIPSFYKGLNKNTYADMLKNQVSQPTSIHQGPLGTCGAAVICRYLLSYYPDKYVNAAISLYETGQYKPWEWKVDPNSKTGTDKMISDLNNPDDKNHYNLTSVDAVVQGAIINSANMALSYNPFSDGQGLSSIAWPSYFNTFFIDKLGKGFEEHLMYDSFSTIDYNNYFVIGLVYIDKYPGDYKDDPNKMDIGYIPTGVDFHYLQIEGVYGNGLKVWSWGDTYTTPGQHVCKTFIIRK